MLVKQIMSTPVVTVSANAPLSDAIRLMLDRHISGLPVVADATGELPGILSEGDLLRRSEVGTGEMRHRWVWSFALSWRHKVPTERLRVSLGTSVPDTLLDIARRVSASFVVAGAYGHSRVREWIIGGTTRELAARSEVPLFMAH